MGGKRNLPTAIKKAQGTLRPDRENPAEPQYGLIKKLPEPPEHMSNLAKSLYNSIGLELSDMGILTAVSLDLFIKYCCVSAEASEAYVKYISKPIKSTMKSDVINPYFKVWNDCMAMSIRLAIEFGITPASSSKVSSSNSKKNEIDDFIS